jgi:hypothetical protein
MKYLVFLLVFLSLTSCVEIIDDLTFKSDGSGTFKYTVNLSASKVKVNSILALDSLDGKKIPSIQEIKDKIIKYKDLISQKEGISNVKVETDFTNFVLKFQCDFASITALQKAIKEIVIDESKTKKEIENSWLSWEGNRLIRSVPSITGDLTSRLKKEDIEGLKKGNYVSITRFDRTIEKCENTTSQIAANKMAVMVKMTPYALIQNVHLLDNSILLSDRKP